MIIGTESSCESERAGDKMALALIFDHNFPGVNGVIASPWQIDYEAANPQ
jgi:hypothetical protein